MSIARLLSALVQGYSIAILIWVVASWVPDLQRSRVVRLIGSLCEPYLALFRALIPPMGGLDLSPVLAILTLQAIGRLAHHIPF